MNQLSVENSSTGSGTTIVGPRTSMLWVAWRQQRFELLMSFSLIGALALGLVFLRLNVVGALDDSGAEECYPFTDGGGCTNAAYGVISDQYGRIASFVPLIMLALPPLLGAVAGGPLFAREYEQGTHVLALTQSISPARWWAVKTAVAGLPVALAMFGLGFVVSWALEPMAAFVSRPLTTPGFETRGLAPGGYFVLAFAVAVTAGIVLRNTVAAIGSTIVVYVALLLVMGFFRPNYLTPAEFRDTIPSSLSGAVAPGAADGWQVDNFFVNSAGDEFTVHFSDCADPRQYDQCVLDQGATAEVIRYQPADRYWPIQAIEAGISVVAAAAILGLGLVRLRRRVL